MIAYIVYTGDVTEGSGTFHDGLTTGFVTAWPAIHTVEVQ